MSKKRNLRSPDGFGEFPQNVESLLRSAAPEDLAVDRDAIFFQAGLNAAAKRRASRFVWPAIAATLVFICAGLSSALFREMHAANALQLALTKLKPSQSIAVDSNRDGTNSAKNDPHELENPAREPSLANENLNNNFARNSRLRNLQRLASNVSLPAGQLTAAGWEQFPADVATTTANTVQPSAADDSSRRPATYRELLRSFPES
jgi:hypothetical protein